ncbi:MAG: glycosyl transferase [Candidatus Nephthysia bennettiae]|uniref:Glycosyltransferase family 4 protein n=1 Tax=Candidatus Nephthysia bennettiae TaxID=3127016 RepID=A0A934KAN4_9BACT|nr:glycosyltransferase family 4 protein [Candidatus Dormibacteraeota bacterium]MBJ7613174.1 glycosyltransferase family 4 protein [Candidatus Dormibacteraeota bacterium]PZR88144.1 MAG: glycosyl transferase [Candidatus Dormibacteraeota bacterium]
MNVFVWHVHGSWTTSFVQGPNRYLVPVLPERGPDGRGRAETYEWPPSVVEVTPEEAASARVDVVVLQRPQELESLAARWLGGRRPGHDLPAVYLEHNCPQGRIAEMRHPAADRPELRIVQVTHFNRLFWDTGCTPVRVIEHGVVDPGHLYEGDLPRAGAAINEPGRRGRVVGADLLPELSRTMPVDVFGIATDNDLPQWRLHQELARRRAYVHPYRWTSLGLALIEAMQIGLPVVALATTEVPEAVPPAAGFVSNNLETLHRGLRRLAADRALAREMGCAAREHALRRYGLARFLDDWQSLLEEVVDR